MGAMDQRLGRRQRRRRVLRQAKRELAGRGLQFSSRYDFGDKSPVIGLGRRKTVFREIYLQGAARANARDNTDGAAAVGRYAELCIGRGEAGVFGGDAEVRDEGEREPGAG